MTPHFKKDELACKCGCGMLPEQSFMDKVEKVRVRYGKPLPVNSAARCPDHNARVSGTGRDGPHTTGRAIDLGVRGVDAYRIVRIAMEEGFTGIGVSQKGATRFIHIDDCANDKRPNVWSY